jgi:Mce-associated membrane protein
VTAAKTTQSAETTGSAQTTEPAGSTEHDVKTQAERDTTTNNADQTTGEDATPGRRRRLVPIALAAVAVISAVVVGLLGWQAYSASRDQRALDDALAAARTATAQVLSYDPRTLDADLANSRKLISGPFAAQFDDLAKRLITPNAQQRHLATKTTVNRVSVIDAKPGEVHTLLFINQTMTMDGMPEPRRTIEQVRVTMTQTDGRWLISELQPL